MTQTSDTETRQKPSTETGAGSAGRTGRRTSLVMAASLGAGLILAVTLCLLAFPGAVEAVITGAALIGFGGGWALLAGLARRTGQPQTWAWIPSVMMVTTGVLLVVTRPGQ